jgi:hypothetical protein
LSLDQKQERKEREGKRGKKRGPCPSACAKFWQKVQVHKCWRNKRKKRVVVVLKVQP